MKAALPPLDEVIRLLSLQPLPVEGGLFVQSYLSAEQIPAAALPARYPPLDKPFGTAIFYLLTNEVDSFSALHRLPTDEIYHFYLGDALETLLLFPDGSAQTHLLGQDILAGQRLQLVVPAGVWQGTRLAPGGRYGLMGSTMAPGFTWSDYEGGNREELTEQYPDQAELIRRLTR